MIVPSRYLAASLCLIAASPLKGALLAYEGFDSSVYNAVAGPTGGYRDPSAGPSDALFYDDDTTRNNSGSGSVEVGQGPAVLGFSGNWGYTANLSPSVYARLQNSQLSYSGLTTTTGQLNLFRSSSSSGSGKGFVRDLNVGPSTVFTQTLYISGLLQRTEGTSFSLSMSSTDGSTDRAFSMSIAGDGITTLTGSGTTGLVSGSSVVGVDSPIYFILKLENSVADGGTSTTSGDRMSLYINPNLADEGSNSAAMVLDSTTADFFVTGNGGWTLGDFRIGSNVGAVGQSVIFDEFKIATEWADLLTVPEPSTSVLGAAALLAVCMRRRR